MIGTAYIAMFKERIDPMAVPVGNFRAISKVMRNYQSGITYYVHFIKEFWYSFGRYYPHIGGIGVSVARQEIEQCLHTPNPWIVIVMPKKEDVRDVRFYGAPGGTWHDYCETNGTYNFHSAIDGLENASISVTILQNIEEHKPATGNGE